MNRPTRLVALTAAALVTVGLVPAQAMAARQPRSSVVLPDLQRNDPVAGRDSTTEFKLPVAPPTQVEFDPDQTAAPNGTTETVTLAPVAGATSRSVQPADELQQLRTMPLALGLAPDAPTGGDGTLRTVAEAAAVTDDQTWTVTMSDRAATEAAGIDGVLMKLTAPAGATAVRVQLDYSTFRDIYGAGWGTRLRLVQFPECFLTTPEAPGCSEATPLPDLVNDADADSVRATVVPPAQVQTMSAGTASTADTGSSVVVAAVGGASGEAGDYQATSMQPSGNWNAGGSSGNFSWSYAVTLPPVAMGPKPSVSLAYSSQSVDGRTSATNNQASWVGDGWDYHPGFIERTYRGCTSDKTGGNNLRGLAIFGQGFGCQFMQRVATPRTRRVLRVVGGSRWPSEGVCDCTRIRCSE